MRVVCLSLMGVSPAYPALPNGSDGREGGRMNRWAVNAYLLELDSNEDGALSLAE